MDHQLIAEKIEPALRELWPKMPEATLVHEARVIARAIADAYPPGDHLAEVAQHAQVADRLLQGIQRALGHLEAGELHDAEAVLQHAAKGGE